MKYELKLRGKSVAFAPLEGVTAVMPTEQASRSRTMAKLTAAFGKKASDDTRGGSVGLVLPARNRKLFERAGWMFVEPKNALAKAAALRAATPNAEAARTVYLGRGGTLIGTDRVTVAFGPGTSAAEVRRRLKISKLKLVRQLRLSPPVYEAQITVKRPELEVVQELQSLEKRFQFVEPVFLEALGGRHTPIDPQYGSQWQHKNDGSNGGVAGADIKSEDAWSKTTGLGVRIAVIDNGMHVRHPDLRDGIVRGAYFTSTSSGTSIFNTWSPGQSGFPTTSHGTFCLGMAGARMDNGRGGCGSAPDADLIPIACMNDQIGTQLTLARAIAYAADPTTEDSSANASDGADVISCSLGPNGADWDMTSVLELAITQAAVSGRGGLGVPIFWAATNGPFDIASDEVCSHPDVMAVSRSNRNDLEDGAGFGPKLEFVAPGVEVFSTDSATGYGFDTGCSFAAPLAAGVAALVLARNPGWTRDQVRDQLRSSCDRVGAVVYNAQGRNDSYGFGRINAARAV